MCAGEMETDSLAESTFGYFLGNEEEQRKIKELFIIVKDRVITSSVQNDIVAKNSIGLFSSEVLKKWVQNHKDVILNCETVGGLLSLLIEVIRDFSKNKELRK